MTSTLTSGRLYPTTVAFPTSIDPGIDDALGVVLNGLVLSGLDSHGCLWRVQSLDGWDGSPASSVETTQKPRGPGAWPSVANLTAKAPSIHGMVEAPDHDALQDAFDRLNAAVTLTDCVMTVRRGSRVRSGIVRREGEVQSTDETGVVFTYTVNLLALDPRKFAASVSGSTALAFSTGGFTVPTVVPTVVASTGSTGTITLTNPGNATGPVLIRVDGPAAGPKITHVTSGLQITFDPTYTLTAGEWVLVDVEAQVALANGQTSRNGYLDTTATDFGWPGFTPGVNLWRVDSASYDPDTLITVTAVPAWL